MKKTVIQQLIDEIVEHLTYDDDLNNDSRLALETLRLVCVNKLKLEKQQIIDAFEIGYDNGACVQEDESIYHGSNYYKKTFKQD